MSHNLLLMLQAALKCNLSSFATAEQPTSALTDSLPDRLIQLACSRLLLATCVKQQMQAIMELHQQGSQPAPPESIKDQGVLLGNASLAEDPATQSSDHEPETDKCQDECALHDEAAAQEDRQLAENAIARLLATRQAEVLFICIYSVLCRRMQKLRHWPSCRSCSRTC